MRPVPCELSIRTSRLKNKKSQQIKKKTTSQFRCTAWSSRIPLEVGNTKSCFLLPKTLPPGNNHISHLGKAWKIIDLKGEDMWSFPGGFGSFFLRPRWLLERAAKLLLSAVRTIRSLVFEDIPHASDHLVVLVLLSVVGMSTKIPSMLEIGTIKVRKVQSLFKGSSHGKKTWFSDFIQTYDCSWQWESAHAAQTKLIFFSGSHDAT